MFATEFNDLPPRSQEKHLAIIDAAKQLFLETGFGPTSMDAVAERAGVSKRTVYSHFECKEALFDSIMSQMCSVLGAAIQEQIDVMMAKAETATGPDPEMAEMLQVLGCRFLTLISDQTDVALFRIIIGEASRFPQLGREFFEKGPKKLTEQLSVYLARQHELGTLDIDDPNQAAWHFLAMVKDPIHLKLLIGLQDTPSQKEIKEIAEKGVDRFLKIYAV
ncbi:TetR/AcrR family transcriptional regulator [Hwanghaeella grinnelliae]|uniref:TetR/AcrR family transcriptional regulator n=1 Tax=Hwanghaeella grinnelliae TaxID=2500179 RepID=A0A3S2VRY8_9PROT|nr:TetR/AcrR family transcriptional regulator [Hwanghaeella grinnelliae]RVU38333.1 TetR/AcrR family transcriptional regulator [Hwanghaeella grinnelliae]